MTLAQNVVDTDIDKFMRKKQELAMKLGVSQQIFKKHTFEERKEEDSSQLSQNSVEDNSMALSGDESGELELDEDSLDTQKSPSDLLARVQELIT